jgi:Cu/Ag efflux protein CusF
MRDATWFLSAVVVLGVASACARKETAPALEAGASTEQPAATPATGEKTYELRGKIVSRDSAARAVTVEHEKIEGLWEPMTMGFEIREGDVSALPPDGSRIRATLHVEDGRYWLTEVRPE